MADKIREQDTPILLACSQALSFSLLFRTDQAPGDKAIHVQGAISGGQRYFKLGGLNHICM